MARIRYRLHYSDTREQLVDHKAQRRGASEDAFWDEDELIDHRRKGNKKKGSKKPGCPGNDGGPHVYVWIDWVAWPGRCPYEIKVCCGCEKRPNRGSFRVKR